MAHDHDDPTRNESESERAERERANRDRRELTKEEQEARARRASSGEVPDSNPPRTTRHGITAPKFGSAGSGGAELEPGPEKD
jgi:hypothetical protein